MSKKKQKHPKEKGQKKSKQGEVVIEVSQIQSDVKSFIKKFKSDVGRKRKAYQLYARKLQKEK